MQIWYNIVYALHELFDLKLKKLVSAKTQVLLYALNTAGNYLFYFELS